MPPILRAFLDYLASPSLASFWWLLLAMFVGSYLLAFIFFKTMPRSGATIIAHGRKAWGLAFLTHAVVTGCVLLPWYFGHRMIAGFGAYFAFYCVLLVISLLLGMALLASARRYQSYKNSTR